MSLEEIASEIVRDDSMSKIYLQFTEPGTATKTKVDGLTKRILKKTIAGILKMIIPKANPDLEKRIDEVKYWFIECDAETKLPEREIGLNGNMQVILKMPFRRNYGYWTDNNLLLDDFKEQFSATEISKNDFDQKWKLLV